MAKVHTSEECVTHIIDVLQKTSNGLTSGINQLQNAYVQAGIGWNDKKYYQLGNVIQQVTNRIEPAIKSIDDSKKKCQNLLGCLDSYKQRMLSTFPKTLHKGRQEKHIKGTNNYQDGKSILTITTEELEILIKQYSGTGQLIVHNNPNVKERVDFGVVIGLFCDEANQFLPTTMGMIHYSKMGTHVVPSKPKEYGLGGE